MTNEQSSEIFASVPLQSGHSIEISSTRDKTKSPNRILLFIHSMKGGGSERQLSYLANELVDLYQVCLVTLDNIENQSYPLDPRIERIGLGLVGNSANRLAGIFANFARVKALRSCIRKWKADAVVSFCDSNNILALRATPKTIPVLISERSDPRKQRLNRFWEFLRRRTYPKCHTCVVQTSELSEYFQATRLASKSKLQVIPSAIVVPPLDRVEIDQARESNSPRILIFVGRLSKEKRVDRLLQAWSDLKQHHSEWQLQIVGDGVERETLQQLALRLGISASVDWALWSDNVWSKLEKANVFCLVSQHEGFPQSMLEAMAAGLPVAVTDCSPSIRETIAHNQQGLVMATDAEIASSLDRLLSNPELRKTIGQKAFERSKDFEWKKIAPRWLDTIEKMLNNSKSSR